MTISTHMQALQKKHDDLENQLDAAYAAPSSDDLYIADLKRRKLHIKDEIEKLKMQLA